MTTNLNTMDWWTTYFTSLISSHETTRNPDAIIKTIGESIMQTLGQTGERPQGDTLPVSDHIAHAQLETYAAERTLTTATCGPWALPYRSALIYCVMHEVDENATFTPELHDKMATDIIRECGLDEYCEGFMDLDAFVMELAKVWSDSLELGMEDAPPADPIDELCATTLRH